MAKAAKFRIFLRNGTEARVRPPSDNAERDTATPANPHKVIFKNKTAMRAFVRLPGGVFVNPANNLPAPSPFVVDLAPEGLANDEVTVKTQGGGDTGLFSFKVFSEKSFDFAEGNSDPEFIIEN